MKRIAVFDLSGIFRRFWHATENEEVSAAFNKTVSTVTTLAAGFDGVAVCVDRPPYERKKLYPEYKAHREKAPDQMYEQLRAVEAQLDADGFYIIGSPGLEADDVIATMADWGDKAGHRVTIFSADKDLLQLVGANVTVIGAGKQEFATIDAVKAKLGVPPSSVPDLLALIGDASDNIPGLDGVGPKTAAKWLMEIGPLEHLIANPDKLPEKFREPMRLNAENLRLWHRLVRLAPGAPILPEVIMEPKPRKEAPNQEKTVMPSDETEDTAPFEETNEHQQEKANGYQPQKDEAPRTLNPMEQKWRDEQLAKRAAAPETKSPPVAEPAAPQPALAIVKPAAPSAPAFPADQTGAPVPWEKALEPRGPAQAWAMASALYKSRMFGAFPNPEAVLAIIMTGRSMGLDAVTSLRSFHMIEGKACPHAHLLIGLVMRSQLCEYFQLVESTDTKATYETKRRGSSKPVTLTYTIQMAANAGMRGGNWQKRPDEMLRKTCGVQLARAVYPDLTQGLYSIEEMENAA